MANSSTPTQNLTVVELPTSQNDAIYSNCSLAKKAAINLTAQSSFDGLSIHYCDVVESTLRAMSEQLPAGLSIDIVLKGEVAFELGEQRYVNHDATQLYSVCVLPQSAPFKLYLQQGIRTKKLNLFAKLSWLKSHFGDQVPSPMLNQLFGSQAKLGQLNLSPEMRSVAVRLASIAEQQDSLQSKILKAQATQLLMLCVQQIFSINDVVVTKKRSQYTPHYLKEQVNYLIANETASQPVSLQEIAQQVNLSVSTLQRRFKSMIGMTVIEYARTARLEKAKRALVDDDLSIGEVAYFSGYQHNSSFISAFTKQFGISPSRYKSIHQIS